MFRAFLAYVLLVAAVTEFFLFRGVKHTEVLLALANFLSFAWASLFFFRRDGAMSPHQRRVLASMYLTGTLHVLAILYHNRGSAMHFISASLLYCTSLVLFWSTIYTIRARQKQFALFFSSKVPDTLLTTGPYQLARHPFYLAYSIAWLAGVIATNRPWLLITVGICGFFYVMAAIQEERKFQESPLWPQYRAYMRRVGMFWPQFGLPGVGLAPVSYPVSESR